MIPMNTEMRQRLLKSLRGNAESNEVLRMSADTSFVAGAPTDALAEGDVISCVKSIASHY